MFEDQFWGIWKSEMVDGNMKIYLAFHVCIETC